MVCEHARAAEPLNYDLPLTVAETGKLESFLGKPLAEHYKVSKVDLNDDGLHEYIVINNECTRQNFCKTLILSDVQESFIELGEADTKTLALSNNYTNGVRNLLVYNHEKNDYDYSVLIWDAPKSSYVFKESGS